MPVVVPVVVIVVPAVVPMAVIAKEGTTDPIWAALVRVQVPSPILRIPAPVLVLAKIPCSSLADELAPPRTRYLEASPVLATLRASTRAPLPLARMTPLV